jgi:hypothetical protein
VFLSAVKPEIVLALMVGGGRGVPLAGFAWPPHSPANFPANQQLGPPTWGAGDIFASGNWQPFLKKKYV